MAINVLLAILATSLATYLSRFLGVITSKKVKENSKIFKWFNCLAYSTLSALLARIIIFPAGALAEVDYLIRFIVVFVCLIIFLISKKNFVYPTVLSALLLTLLSSNL
ncbi:branched-subunit amino acid transport protein AzlD [Candidatus Pelagibacter ubique]|uniref:Branched-subunit amino acid transport protein AzlD n=1 Tax=Pelagibacter ubique TaxID=198252 RepID=A0ABX1T0K7_PELUQ|nr:AzlD domain-containing protein [Candidatus Pelagibacter ubique]NMN67647.1 branched-subunit amino acid transport protein AzlD [Candidatus Pelagibacter ubique]